LDNGLPEAVLETPLMFLDSSFEEIQQWDEDVLSTAMDVA
jgi:hypothetical protein